MQGHEKTHKKRHMKRHKKTHMKEEIIAHVAGDLTAVQTAALLEHLEDCASCRRDLDELGVLREILASEPGSEPPRSVWPMVAAELRPQPGIRLGLPMAFGTATAAAAGILLGIVIGGSEPQPAADVGFNLWSTVGTSLVGDSSMAAEMYEELEQKEASR